MTDTGLSSENPTIGKEAVEEIGCPKDVESQRQAKQRAAQEELERLAGVQRCKHIGYNPRHQKDVASGTGHASQRETYEVEPITLLYQSIKTQGYADKEKGFAIGNQENDHKGMQNSSMQIVIR